MQHILIIASCLCLATFALYSCSMQVPVTTNGQGHIVGLSSISLELARPAVAMLVAGGQLALELRWQRSLSPRDIGSFGG